MDTSSPENIRDGFGQFYDELRHVAASILRVYVDTETATHPCSPTGKPGD